MTAIGRQFWSRHRVYLSVLVLLGLALRLWFASVNVIDPRFSASDDGDYYQRALRLAVTGQYIDDSWLIRPPMHVFIFAALLRLSLVLSQPEWGIPLIRTLHIGLSLLAILIGYDLSRRLFNRRAGLIFATFLAVWFPLVELPILVLSEPLFLFLLLLNLWLLLRWRDSRHWGWLAAAGLALGTCALTRSPALYSTAFVLLFLLLENKPQRSATNAPASRFWQRWLLATVTWSALFLGAFLLVVGPWIVRNYVVYQRFIPVDTLGPVNLWLALQPERVDGGKTILSRLPQQERQDFVSAEIARILSEDPTRLFRDFVPHFVHIWKAQFAEDFLVKPSFYTRPLRAIWPLGALGDLLWFVFTLAGLLGLAAPLREGAFRWIALGWIGYIMLTVMIFHVEPRYLLPVWLLLALYGSAVLAMPSLAALRSSYRPLNTGLAALLVLAFLVLVFSYRNYPAFIARGIQRELHHAAGARAYAAGDYATAIREFEQVIAVQPDFIDGRSDLALALITRGEYAQAWEVLGTRQTHRSDVVRGAITRAQGQAELAAAYFTDAERRAGEDVQALTRQWLPHTPINRLTLGNGLDFGYLQGFSFGEILTLPDGRNQSYRWLQGRGVIDLPLNEPLHQGSVVELRMAFGAPEGSTLRLRFNDATTVTVPVAGGQWRSYRVAVPDSLAGQQRLLLELEAPTFIPAQQNPASSDARSLSLMISTVAVE